MLIYKTQSSAESFMMNSTWAGAKDVIKAIVKYDNNHENATAFETAIKLLEEFFGEESYMEEINDYQINDYIWFQLADDLVDFGYDIWE